jgi:hypothetical protein
MPALIPPDRSAARRAPVVATGAPRERRARRRGHGSAPRVCTGPAAGIDHPGVRRGSGFGDPGVRRGSGVGDPGVRRGSGVGDPGVRRGSGVRRGVARPASPRRVDGPAVAGGQGTIERIPAQPGAAADRGRDHRARDHRARAYRAPRCLVRPPRHAYHRKDRGLLGRFHHAATSSRTALAALSACAWLACGGGEPHAAVGRPRPPVPAPLAPRVGGYVGSPWAAGAWGRRPEFRWRAAPQPERITYELEIDDDCEPGALQACRFTSPEVRADDIDDTTWRPPAPLPIDATPPLGRRYYWRLRACARAACSAWTRVRYLEVGRVPGDLNGDGYSDLVVTAPLIDGGGRDRGAAFLYFGGPSGLATATVTRLNDPLGRDGDAFGVAAAIAGDLDADGYADLLIGAAGAGEHQGAAYVFHGAAYGIHREPRALLVNRGANDDWFGASVAGVGDVDGDGYADALVGASGVDGGGRDWGRAWLFPGGARGVDAAQALRLESLSPRDYDHFGYALAGAGDLNGDGYADLVFGSPGIDIAGQIVGVDRGAVYVFHGGPDRPSQLPAARLEAPLPLDHDRFGFAVASAGDTDGDGYDDILIGAPGSDAATEDAGAVYLFRGGPGGVQALPTAVLEDPRIETFDRFGTSVAAAGDVDGDGFADIVVGTSGAERGRGLVFHGGREGVSPVPGAVLHDPLGPGYNHFADAVAGAGDVDGDGLDDVLIGASGSDNGGVFRGSAVLYRGGTLGVAADRPLRVDNPDTGEHDHFGHAVAGR